MNFEWRDVVFEQAVRNVIFVRAKLHSARTTQTTYSQARGSRARGSHPPQNSRNDDELVKIQHYVVRYERMGVK